MFLQTCFLKFDLDFILINTSWIKSVITKIGHQTGPIKIIE